MRPLVSVSVLVYGATAVMGLALGLSGELDAWPLFLLALGTSVVYWRLGKVLDGEE